jgi:fructose-1,6-bisphosphatase I
MFFQSIGEFLLIDRNMQIKPRGKIYSFNEGGSRDWHEPVKNYLHSLKNPKVKCPFPVTKTSMYVE